MEEQEIQTLQEPEDFAEETIEGPSLPDRRLIGIGGGAAVLLVTGVALAALFLPPFNLAAQMRGCQALDANNPAALGQDGISAMWVGPDSVRICLGSIPLDEFLAGQTGGDLKGAALSVPPFLQMLTPLYTAEKVGEGDISLEIVLPGDAQPYEMLDLYGWDSATQQWVFIPGHVDVTTGTIRTDVVPHNVAVFLSKPITPLVGTTLESNQVMDSTTASALNIILPTGLTLQSNGSLSGSLTGGWQIDKGYAVVPAVRSADASGLSDILNNDAGLALLIDDLKTFIVGDGYHGVAIDYSNVNPADRDRFTGFIADLATALHAYNKLVVVVVPPPTSDGTGLWDSGAYDWRGIGASADAVVINVGNNPADYAVGGTVTTMLKWAVGEVSRVKLYLVMSSSSAQDAGGAVTTISYDEALAPLGTIQAVTAPEEDRNAYDPGAQISFNLNGSITDFTADQNTGAYVYSVSNDSGQRKVWIVTAATIRARLDMANQFGIGGMMLNDLASGSNDGGLLTVINEFKASSASTVPSQLVMTWTVTGASGAVLNQTAGIGTPLAWLAGDAGDYTIQGQIVGGRISDRGSVGVQVAPPTTPPPTNAPVVVVTVDPNATPKPTSVATTPPPPPPASVGGAGSDGGSLELGGQVNGSIGHPNEMKHAGMTWVKFQAKYGSVDVGTAAAYVAQGRAAGFKVLISIPGPPYPSSTINYAGAVEFMKQVAANAKPDAIEVWNEMNIINEWPEGQIDPNAYVNNMLAPAFNAIKSVSPSTMVIIGALAPTGCDNGTRCWSDQRYAQGLAAAGAANFANCMGVHHNSGTTSPSAATGHPYDSGDHHYSWYFLPTVNVTYNAMGNALPMCLTEYGYLSPEGYGPLSSAFAWGANTTVAQQAAWLAEGYQISKGLGYIRMMIVWNVDFTNYGADPMAGFAIVRPGGGCPACDSLHGVTP